MLELWERQHALIEKRHAFVMNQLTDIDKRVQRDADSFMSSVKTAEDDNAVVLLVMMYPRIASNEAAYSAYKEAIARMRREG